MSLLKTLVAKVEGAEDNETDIPIPPDDFVKDMIDADDREPIQNRAGTFSGYVHVSSLAKNFCSRHYAIALHEKLPLYEVVTGGMRVVWAQGRASEDHAREAFIRRYGIRNIYARWTCETGEEGEGHSIYQGWYKTQKCSCGKNLNKYTEAHLFNHDAKVVGRPDLIFRYKNWANVVEIKSIKSEIDSPNKNQHVTFEDLEKPIQDHLNQAQFYPDLLKRTDPSLKVSPFVRYFYIAKNFKFGSPYKEFIEDHRAVKYERNRNELYEEAKQIHEFIETGVLPPRVCPVFSSPMAKKCALNARCFYTYEDKV